MIDWMDTVFALATGWMLGVVVTRLHFQAQLKLCRQVIAERLDAVNSSLMRPVRKAAPEVFERVRDQR
jgi:hypothetical protein